VRYDDPERLRAENGARLQLSGSPLPVVTLLEPGSEPGSWLACIHAHRGGNRFGYHSAVLEDLTAFSADWLEDPEAALEKYFGYTGPEEAAVREPTKPRSVPAPAILTDLWED
jgi:hypothetical protein